jgi:hypothetical protein
MLLPNPATASTTDTISKYLVLQGQNGLVAAENAI